MDMIDLLYEEFNEAIEAYPDKEIFYDKGVSTLKKTNYGVSYLYDALVPCHIVYHAGKFWDVCERDDEIDLTRDITEQLDGCMVYDTASALIHDIMNP